MKVWWRAHGNRVTAALAAVLAAVLAYQGWSWYGQRQSAAASVLYAQFDRAAESKDPKDAAKARDLAGTLVDAHGSTVYAALAALRMARINLDAGDANAARAQLTWTMDHAREQELALLARVRLAGELLDVKQYDEALRVLNVDVPAAFAGEFADRRGDVYAAQGKFSQARAAYAEALTQAGTQPSRALIQMKLDALPASGGA